MMVATPPLFACQPDLSSSVLQVSILQIYTSENWSLGKPKVQCSTQCRQRKFERLTAQGMNDLTDKSPLQLLRLCHAGLCQLSSSIGWRSACRLSDLAPVTPA